MSDQPAKGVAEDKITEDVEQYLKSVTERLQEARSELNRAFLQEMKAIDEDVDEVSVLRTVDEVIITLLSGGHALLEGVPGTAKTTLVEAVGRVFGLEDKRIQCTPDLMPSDILGTEIMEENKASGERSFRFIKGPIFAGLVMADEINRASPRTQSAFLQGMQEKKVTVGGETYSLPKPFHVLATQNPVEQEGTNPLPEAQLDRFLLQSEVTYPDRESEKTITLGTTTTHYSWKEIMNEDLELDSPRGTLVNPKDLKQVFNAKSLIHLQHVVRKLPIGTKPLNAILDIVRNARPNMRPARKGERETENIRELSDYVNTNVAYGPGTRALQAFALATRAHALLDGRLSPTVDDVKLLAQPVLRHRIAPSIMAGATRPEPIRQQQIIEKLVASLG